MFLGKEVDDPRSNDLMDGSLQISSSHPVAKRREGLGADLRSAAQFQFLNDFLILLQIVALHVVKQLASLAGHFDEAVSGVDILAMGSQVFSEMGDPSCEQGDLHLARSGIFLVRLVFCYDSFFFYVFGHDDENFSVRGPRVCRVASQLVAGNAVPFHRVDETEETCPLE